MKKIKVMVIDDSAIVRKYLTETLSKSPIIEVVGTALDPYIAANKILKLKPDIITLDIEMPRMDGITFLSKLMISNPMPVIMVSSFTDKGATETMKALELGAVDFILKPKLENEEVKKEFEESLIEKITTESKLKIRRKPAEVLADVGKKYSADVILAKKDPRKTKKRSEKIIAIGASTGGTEVIDKIFVNIPEDMPGIVVAQHMPEKFTDAFANRVNIKSHILVKEAENKERVYHGMALVAPGGKHMLLRSDRDGYYVEINDGPPVNRHKPSVDVLFRSVSQVAGSSAVGVICTGMGSDGAQGLLEMKQAGASTIAQNEASSVVYGMPREAIAANAVDHELNIDEIINYLVNIKI